MIRVKSQLRLSIEKFQRSGSGWTFCNLISAHIDAAKFRPLTAGGYIELPKKLEDMKSTLNIKSTDQRCFLYVLLAKLCLLDDEAAAAAAKLEGLPEPEKKKFPPPGERDKCESYIPYESELEMGDITYPIKLKDIAKVERDNNLSISVFEWDLEEHCTIPMRQGCGVGRAVELLYIENEFTSHFVLITNFNAYMRHKTKYHHSKFYCMKCLFGFLKEQDFKDHTERCTQKVYQVPKMPKNHVIKFLGYDKKMRKLFIIYADFECLLVPVDGEGQGTSYTQLKQRHVPCSFCIVTESEFEDYEGETIVFSDPDPDVVTKTFLSELDRLYQDMMFCYDAYSYPIDMTAKSEARFKNSSTCHICKKKVNPNSKNNYGVRDHNHFQQYDNFRGKAHSFCNLNYWERTKKAIVVFHNLK